MKYPGGRTKASFISVLQYSFFSTFLPALGQRGGARVGISRAPVTGSQATRLPVR